MEKHFCDRCKKEMGLIVALQIVINPLNPIGKKTISLCLKCKKEFFKFMGYSESGVGIVKFPEEIITDVCIDKRLENLKTDINSKRTEWTNVINKILKSD